MNRKLCGVIGVARQALGRQQHVRHAADLGFGIVEHDRHARSQPQRDDHRIGAIRRPVGHFHDQLARLQAGLR